MEKSFSPLLCQGHQHYTFISGAAVTLQVAFFRKAVHIRGQGSHGDMQFPGDPGHALGFLDADGFEDVHIIICNIPEFVCYDCLCSRIHHVMEHRRWP